MTKIDQWYQTAYRSQKTGDLAKAEPLYHKILKLQPHHIEALYLLGSVYAQRAEYARALPYLEKALLLNPQFTEALNNRGIALKELGRTEEAITCYDQALAIRPDYAEALNNRGIALQAAGRLEDALDSFRRAADLHSHYVEPLNNLGLALKEHSRFAEAEDAFRQATERQPEQPEAFNNLGLVLLAQSRFNDALRSFDHALALKPSFAQAWSNRGAVLKELSRYEDARASYVRALELNPRYAEAQSNLGVCLLTEGRIAEGMAALDQTLAWEPEHVNTHWNRSLGLLLKGDFPAGWQEYEWRFRNKSVAAHISGKPLWDGASFAGKTLLVHAEQGLGDTLHFVRYLPLVKARGGRVLFECQPLLRPLLESVTEIDALLEPPTAGEDHTEPYDMQVPLLSLPSLFGTTLETIPADVPYLQTPLAAQVAWQARMAEIVGTLGDGQLKVGLVWAGSSVHKNDHNRSCALDAFAPLAQIPNILFFSLQKGSGAAQAANAPAGMTLLDLSPALFDFSDTAAILDQLDLVIAVDTSVVHLAGALGKPVWVLVPYAPDWRWMMERADSPWYPTMRLFRQPAPGQWEPVFAQIAEELSQWAATESDTVEALVEQGETAYAAGNEQDAVRCFEEALTRVPTHSRTANNLAVLAYARGAFDEAVTYLDNALQADPNHLGALENRAKCAEALGQHSEAALWYQKAIVEAPQEPSLWNALGTCCRRIGAEDAAQEAFSQSLHLARTQEAETAAGGITPPVQISVVLHTTKQAEALRPSRDAYGAQTLPSPEFEVIVGACRNQGIAKARGRLVVIVGDDTQPAPDFLVRHLAAHDRHPEPSVAIRSVRKAGPGMRNAVLFHVLEDAPVENGLLAFCANGVSFKRDFLTDAPVVFDERFAEGAEDCDLAWRLEARGLTLIKDAQAVLHVLHADDLEGGCQKAEAQGQALARLTDVRRSSALLHRLGVADVEHRLPGLEAEWERASTLIAQLRTLEQAGWETVRALPDSSTTLLPALTGLCRTGLEAHRLRGYRNERRTLEAAGTVQALTMPQETLVSVIIACYNYAHFLPEAADSVLDQTYQNWEMIIVNDGSTDDTAGVAEQIIADNPGRRIRLITQANMRLAGARNTGIRHAAGRYILPLDADDIIEPTLLAKCVSVLDSAPHLSMVYTDQIHFDETGRVWNAFSRDWDYTQELHANQVCVCCLFRSSMWEEVGGFREDCIGAEDWDFWIAVGEIGHEAWRIPETLFRYRRHGASLSATDDLRQDYLKADIVLHHPHLYGPSRVGWACGVKAGYEWLHPKPGEERATATALVSVIVPTFNRPQMLAHALESILAQTYRHFEIIVVNDAGVDVSVVIEPLNEEHRITLINKPANKGLADSRNVGIAAARGKYIAYLDDDDLYYTDHLETLVTFLENTGHQVAYADALRAHQRPCPDGTYEVWKRDQPYSFDFDYDAILRGNFSPVQCFMHAKSCLDEVGGFDTTLTSHEDWELWIRLSRRYDCIHLKHTTSEFSWRQDGSTMTGAAAQSRDMQRTAAAIYRKYRPLVLEKPALLAHYDAFLQQSNATEAEQTAASSLTSPAVSPTITLTTREIKKRRLDPYKPCPCGSGQKLRFCHADRAIDAKLLAGAIQPWKTDILVVVHNQRDYTQRCIDSLYRHTQDFHLLLWDNGSDAPTRAYLEEIGQRENVTLQRSEENLGFIVPNNRLAALGRAPFVILLNSDTEVSPGWDTVLCDMLTAHPEIGEVGYEGGLLGPDGIGGGRGQGGEIDYVAGWCACLSRRTVEQHGLLDEQNLQFAYGEDSDLSLRLQEAGLQVYALDETRVTHFGNKTIADVSRRRDTRSTFEANHAFLRRRWAAYLRDDRVLARQEKTRRDDWERDITEAEELYAVGDLAQARARFETLAAQRPHEARPWNNLGVLSWHESQPAAALEAFVQAYRADPQDRLTVLNLSNALCAFGQTNDAAAVLQTYLATQGEDTDMRARLSVLEPAALAA